VAIHDPICMKAVLLAAGKSTRTYPLTLSRPKPLIPILNRPLINYTISGLTDMIDEWVIVVCYKAEEIKQYIKETFPNLSVQYVHMEEATGTGKALQDAKEYLMGESFIVLNGDDMYHPRDVKRLIDCNSEFGAMSMPVEHPERFGIFRTNGDIAVELVEKPTTFVSNLANIGCYKFNSSIFDLELKKSSRGEYEIVDYINYLLQHQHKVELLPVEEYWYPMTYPWDVLVAQEDLLRRADIKQRIHDSADIDSTAYIGNNVVIGENCKVGPNVELENSCLFEGVTIEANVRITDSVLAENTVVKEDTIIDGTSTETVMLPIKGGDMVEVAPAFKGVASEAGSTISGFHMEPAFITKEK